MTSRHPPITAIVPDPSREDPWTVAHVEIRPAELAVYDSGRQAPLTIREFHLLATLARTPNHVIPDEVLSERVWGGGMPARDRTVEQSIRRITKKLATIAPHWAYLHSYGDRYRFLPERVRSL
jgi:DNA-binding response OmpR family regulator